MAWTEISFLCHLLVRGELFSVSTHTTFSRSLPTVFNYNIKISCPWFHPLRTTSSMNRWVIRFIQQSISLRNLSETFRRFKNSLNVSNRTKIADLYLNHTIYVFGNILKIVTLLLIMGQWLITYYIQCIFIYKPPPLLVIW